MNLEVGMYVRTEDGLIAKYIKVNNEYEKHIFDGEIEWYYEEYRNEIYFEDWEEFIFERVVKASHNIIDLIEVGDYVNGFPVIHKENDILKCGLLVQFKENEIKSIVTKEQFESMKYSLEG